ncbi:MAG: DEAD/DEAH box helicase [Candidatus Obscuribacterales bacterium]
MSTFVELGLSGPVLKSLKDIGFVEPTDIQRQTIGIALNGRDVVASAHTGSGKTAAYGLPLVDMLEERDESPRALVLVPTRELAMQVSEQLKLFAKHNKLRVATLYGGTSYHTQRNSLERGVDVIVATPGRLIDFMESKTVSLATIEVLVLDEADRMMDMGFMPQVRRIINRVPTERQTMMFSATIDDRIERLASTFCMEPAIVRVNTEELEPDTIEQRVINVHEFAKDDLLFRLLQEFGDSSVLVFTGTRRKATWVTDRLRDSKVIAEEVHGDISQKQRESTIARFRRGEFPVLVATDVAARGLDITNITHVINYDVPNTPEEYVHRIGRTGRNGKTGIAVTFVSEEQQHLLRDVEKLVGREFLPPIRPASKTASPGGRSFGRGRRRIV